MESALDASPSSVGARAVGLQASGRPLAAKLRTGLAIVYGKS